MLILLDNAANEAQVAPLLPGAPGCLVLVTSRSRLAGLDDTRRLSLDTLTVPDAVTLFAQIASDGETLGDQPADLVVELVELCGRLPLAIRIASARLRSHPSWDLSHLVERLRDPRHRLDELAAGHRSVTAALLDSTPVRATRILDQLLDAHLLLEPAAGRYRLHDLTRAHAAHTATRDQGESRQARGAEPAARLPSAYRIVGGCRTPVRA